MSEMIFKDIEKQIVDSYKVFETKSFTYDYEPIVKSNLINKYKMLVKELGDMMVDLPEKLPKFKELEEKFFEELKDISQLYILV